MNTLLLNPKTWDLVKDANGNIAMCSAPYAIAQDVATACSLFSGELWYDTRKGVPYLTQILGKRPSLPFVKAQLEKAALTVPNVHVARCTFASFKNRALKGQVRVTDNLGNIIAVGLGSDTVFVLDQSQLDSFQLG